MAASLLRHRRAILIGVFGVYFAVGEWQAGFVLPLQRLIMTYLGLLPPFAALFVAVAGLLALLVARRGEPLDRRPRHAALTGVSLIWIGVYLLVIGGSVSAFASAIAGCAFLIGALLDWMKLFALLRSKTLIEQRGAVGAPPIVEGMTTPIALFEPANAAYRNSAKGEAIAAVPVDRMAAQKRLAAQVVVAVACAFVALPGGALAAVPSARCTHRASTPWLDLLGTTWQGEIADGGVKRHFTLTIEETHDGQFSGVMDWGDNVANVEGTYSGDRLVFYDRSIRRTSGVQFILNERKDVRVSGDRMIGTDKDGRVPLIATRVR